MLVRIRFGKGPRLERRARGERRVALALSALLKPVAVMAASLAVWRLAADLDWAGDFAFPSGIFSHWQVWLVFAALLLVGSRALHRHGKGGGRAAS